MPLLLHATRQSRDCSRLVTLSNQMHVRIYWHPPKCASRDLFWAEKAANYHWALSALDVSLTWIILLPFFNLIHQIIWLNVEVLSVEINGSIYSLLSLIFIWENNFFITPSIFRAKMLPSQFIVPNIRAYMQLSTYWYKCKSFVPADLLVKGLYCLQSLHTNFAFVFTFPLVIVRVFIHRKNVFSCVQCWWIHFSLT